LVYKDFCPKKNAERFFTTGLLTGYIFSLSLLFSLATSFLKAFPEKHTKKAWVAIQDYPGFFIWLQF
jgi:hypothetical protein